MFSAPPPFYIFKVLFAIVILALVQTPASAQNTKGEQKASQVYKNQYYRTGITSSDYKKDTLKQFFDYKWQKTGKMGSYFYTIAYPSNNGWVCEDYDVVSKTISSYMVYADQELTVLNGPLFTFYPNGNTKASGRYANNLKEGQSQTYYEQGQLKDSTNWLHDVPVGPYYSFYPSGKISETCFYDSSGRGTGPYTSYRENGAISQTGQYSEGQLKDSTWTYYFSSGKVSFIEKFLKDSCIFVQCFNEDGTTKDTCQAQEDAEFPGGEKALKEYWSDNIFFPPGFSFESVNKATVWVGFVVTKNGFIKDIKVLRSVDELFDEQVVKAVKGMPRWKPCKRYHEPVDQRFILPAVFKQYRNY
jgi:antitoxin component YwqK of YwqJK toxin-antitoxin module